MYETLRTIKLATDPPRNVRITMLYPTTDWDRVWSNLHATWAADAIKVNWFKVIHDILPTMSDYMPSGLRARPSPPLVESKAMSCTG